MFSREPIRFRQTTARALSTLGRSRQLEKLSEICLANAESLLTAVQAVSGMGIGAFRALSPIFPRYTHPDVGYELDDLPEAAVIRRFLADVNVYRTTHDIRLSFHPDQFVTISSPRDEVVYKSLEELEYQGLVAELIGADVINLHGGGAFGDKETALQRFRRNFEKLSERVRRRLTLENDDVVYTVKDLHPLCEDLGIPLVYDVHHHRCHPDGLSVDEATGLSVETWAKAGREPYFHISSPERGWETGNPRRHADYVDIMDFPGLWMQLTATIDVEARAKELAVVKLMRDLADC
ncbi:MAG: UV DNA damage repair endonuclease UvsE [Syntrophobacteraceae bacterium]|nr:UV DNA damage repair endonuclease UvsE [Syntrophobacteraceae bacterium]